MLYFAHSFIIDHITLDNYYHLLSLCKKKAQYKMENNELKKVHFKNCTCYYIDDIIRLEDFGLDNILIDEKSHVNIFLWEIDSLK